MYSNFKMDKNAIYHHGTKGMKWGIRRYQNKDGSLTSAGRKRYEREAKENNWEIGADGVARSTSRKSKGDPHEADPNKWVKEDMERSKRLTDASSTMTRELKNANDRAIKNKPKTRMDLSKMTDKEMRDKINRELLERQYNDVFNQQNTSRGREYAGKVLDGAGTALAITSSALGIALAIKELRG